MKKTLELFSISKDEIVPANKITPEDVVLVLDKEKKQIYVYKGHYCQNFDEFQANSLYERIINRFLNPNIFLLKTLIENEEDSDRLIEIKEFIVDHYPNLSKFELKRSLRNIFLLKGFRQQISAFKSYENSRDWRYKLSNLTNIRRLSIFNVLAGLAVVMILIIQILADIAVGNFLFIGMNNTINVPLWNLWLEKLSIVLGLCITIISINFIINALFVLFPLRFPISPQRISSLNPRKTASVSIQKDRPKSSKVTQVEETELKKSPPMPKMPPVGKSSKKLAIPKMAAPTLNISLGAPALPNPELTKKKDLHPLAKNVADRSMASIDADLFIPAPPKKKAIKLDVGEVELAALSKKETKETKYILIECQICGVRPIMMPVPKTLVLDASEPVVDVTYAHGDPEHVVVAQLDHDFQVRRRRASYIVYEKDYR